MELNVELAPLRSFVAIARTGHLTRAARALHLSQPAVSAQLARLEEELGAPLFHRTPKGMELTDAGHLFRGHVERALAALERGREAVDALQGLALGRLSVGGGATATTYLLPPLLRAFHEAHPAIRLYVREQGSAASVDAVIGGELDLGVVTLPVDPRSTAQLEVLPWLEDDLRLIVPPHHPLSGADTFRWAQLQGLHMVGFEGGSSVRRLIDDALASAAVDVEIVMELRSIESIKQMVAQGIGAAFVSRFALPEHAAGLQPQRRRGTGLHRSLGVVWRRDRAPSPAARAFLELLRARADTSGPPLP